MALRPPSTGSGGASRCGICGDGVRGGIIAWNLLGNKEISPCYLRIRGIAVWNTE
jgi:hypothetical protein